MKLHWRSFLPAAALAIALPAHAQQPPAPQPVQQQNPVCVRLETQLQTFDRSNNDAGRAEQLGKLEAAAASQQTEIDRQEATARRMGCERNSFFAMLSGQPQQCGPITNKIQSMKDNLERLQGDAEKLRGEPPQEREGQRRTILAALAQNNCGAQYQQAVAAPPPRRRGLFETLFGPRDGGGSNAPVEGNLTGDPNAPPPSGTFRTVCVRMCDGFFYPISYVANASKFADDEKTCRASCPASEVQLYIHRNPGEGINEAVSVNGQQPYTALPNAFKYRAALDQSCSCRRPGESWAHALKSVEDGTVEQGDIIVNDQRARQLSQPRVDAQGRPIRQPPAARQAPQQTGSTPTPAPAAAQTATADKPDEAPRKPDPNRTVRAVGPTFLPAK